MRRAASAWWQAVHKVSLKSLRKLSCERYVAKVSLAFSKILQCACLCNLKLKENYPDLKFLTNVLSCDQYTYDEFRRMDKRMGEAGAKG